MAAVTWGMLEKSQTDDETIEEAINRLIAAADLLPAHKASEIIDHVAGSIISDKISRRQVTLDKLDFDRFLFLTMFESLSPWYQTNTGARGIIELRGPVLFIQSGNHANDIASVQLIASPLNVNENSDPYFAVSILAADMDSSETYVWVMTSDDVGVSSHYGFGFLYDPINNKLCAFWGDGSNQHKQDTGISNFSSVMGLKADYNHLTHVLNFYVNDTLVWSTVANGLTCGNDPMLSIGQKSNAAAYGPDMYIYNAIFSQGF